MYGLWLLHVYPLFFPTAQLSYLLLFFFNVLVELLCLLDGILTTGKNHITKFFLLVFHFTLLLFY